MRLLIWKWKINTNFRLISSKGILQVFNLAFSIQNWFRCQEVISRSVFSLSSWKYKYYYSIAIHIEELFLAYSPFFGKNLMKIVIKRFVDVSSFFMFRLNQISVDFSHNTQPHHQMMVSIAFPPRLSLPHKKA